MEWPCVPCAGPGRMAVCCMKSRECVCMERRTGGMISSMPCVPGICSMCFSACGQYLAQLSSEADCIHVHSVVSGELLYAAPAGVFPRCMKLDRRGKTSFMCRRCSRRGLFAADAGFDACEHHLYPPSMLRGRFLAEWTGASVRCRGRGYPNGCLYAAKQTNPTKAADRIARSARRAVRMRGRSVCTGEHPGRFVQAEFKNGCAFMELSRMGAVHAR